MHNVARLLDRAETGFTGLLALAAICLTVNESLLRFISPGSLPDWSAEVTVYCIGWAVMLCASRLVRENSHVRVEMLVESLSPRTQRMAELFTCIVGVIVSAGLIFAGLKMVEFARMLGEQSDSSIHFPMWIYYAAIPAGFLLTGGQYAVRFVQILRGRAF